MQWAKLFQWLQSIRGIWHNQTRYHHHAAVETQAWCHVQPRSTVRKRLPAIQAINFCLFWTLFPAWGCQQRPPQPMLMKVRRVRRRKSQREREEVKDDEEASEARCNWDFLGHVLSCLTVASGCQRPPSLDATGHATKEDDEEAVVPACAKWSHCALRDGSGTLEMH